MDAATILANVQLALSLGKMAIEIGEEAAPFLKNAYDIAFGDKVLTAEERALMQQQETGMRSRIDAVIAADDAAATS